MTNLRFAIIRDLVADARFFQSGAQGHWVERCRQEIRLLVPQRHSMRLDEFGWPVLLKKAAKSTQRAVVG